MAETRGQKKRKNYQRAEDELAAIFGDDQWRSNGRARCDRIVEILESFPELAAKTDFKVRDEGGIVYARSPLICILMSPSANKCLDTYQKVFALSEKHLGEFPGSVFSAAFTSYASIPILQQLLRDLPIEDVFEHIYEQRIYQLLEQDPEDFPKFSFENDNHNPLASLTPSNSQSELYSHSMDRLSVLISIISAARPSNTCKGLAYMELIKCALNHNTTTEVLRFVAEHFKMFCQCASFDEDRDFYVDTDLEILESALVDVPQVEILKERVLPYILRIYCCGSKWTIEGYRAFLEALVSYSSINYICGFPIPSPTHHPELYASINALLTQTTPFPESDFSMKEFEFWRAEVDTFVEAGDGGRVNEAVRATFQTEMSGLVLECSELYIEAFFRCDNPQPILPLINSLPSLNFVNFGRKLGVQDITPTVTSVMDDFPNIERLDVCFAVDWELFGPALRRNTSLKYLSLHKLDNNHQQAILQILEQSNKTLVDIKGSFSPDVYRQIQYRLLLNVYWPEIEVAGNATTSLSTFIDLFDAIDNKLPDEERTADDELNVTYALLHESPFLWANSGAMSN